MVTGTRFHQVTEQVQVQVTTPHGHTEEILLNIAPIGKHEVILGLPWFRYHGVQFDWDNGDIAQWSPKCEGRCFSSVATLHTAPVLLVQRLCPDAYLPTRGTTGAVGQDLYAVTEHDIRAGERALVSTGLAIGVPGDTYGQIAPRSGLALRQGVTVGTGVIDPDYRGEVKVLLFNHGSETFQVQRGMRIAQLILENCSTVPLVEVDSLPDTKRDQDGFGSTGLAEMVDIFAIELGHANVKKIRPQEQRYANLRKVIPTEYHDYLDVFDEELGMSCCPEH
jgi:dUTP pyrophosphatase